MIEKTERPEIVSDAHLIYLDELRESGATNMWGAGEYLEHEFCLARNESKTILIYWMNTFGERHPRGE